MQSNVFIRSTSDTLSYHNLLDRLPTANMQTSEIQDRIDWPQSAAAVLGYIAFQRLRFTTADRYFAPYALPLRAEPIYSVKQN